MSILKMDYAEFYGLRVQRTESFEVRILDAFPRF